jgi:hypothetical protein
MLNTQNVFEPPAPPKKRDIEGCFHHIYQVLFTVYIIEGILEAIIIFT